MVRKVKSELPEPFARILASLSPRHDAGVEAEIVAYDHAGAPMEGFLACPRASVGRNKALLVLHAWSGVGPNVEMRALMLARLGYTALAADLYGSGVRPATMPAMKAEADSYYADLPLLRARVAAGFDVLVGRGFAPEDIVVIGYCFGGTAALEFARNGQASAGIVSIHGNLIVHEPSDAAQISAPLLIISGAADDLVSDEIVKAFVDELRAADAIEWEFVSYSGAPHAFTVPGERFRPVADARSWRRLVDFLDEVAPVGIGLSAPAEGVV